MAFLTSRPSTTCVVSLQKGPYVSHLQQIPSCFLENPPSQPTKSSLRTKHHFQKVSAPRAMTGPEQSASSLRPSRNASASARHCAPCRETTRPMDFVAFLGEFLAEDTTHGFCCVSGFQFPTSQHSQLLHLHSFTMNMFDPYQLLIQT